MSMVAHRVLTPQQEKTAARLYAKPGATLASVAEQMGVGKGVVRGALVKQGVDRHPNGVNPGGRPNHGKRKVLMQAVTEDELCKMIRAGMLYDDVRLVRKKIDIAGACDLCGTPCKALAVDHDHATGITRGLLCRGCNTGLGHFRDDPALLRRAAKYITKKGR